MNERRDLQMELVSASGYPLSVPKGGLPVVGTDSIEVRAVYRDRNLFVRLPGDATPEATRDALLAKAEGIDDEITLAELEGAEV